MIPSGQIFSSCTSQLLFACICASPAPRPQEAGGVTFVYEHHGPVPLGEVADSSQRSHVSVHGEDAVCHHQAHPRRLRRENTRGPPDHVSKSRLEGQKQPATSVALVFHNSAAVEIHAKSPHFFTLMHN